jgi:hypothetical protein
LSWFSSDIATLEFSICLCFSHLVFYSLIFVLMSTIFSSFANKALKTWQNLNSYVTNGNHIHKMLQTGTVQKPERTDSIAKYCKCLASRITTQHPISHRPMEKTGSSRNPRKRGSYSSQFPIKKNVTELWIKYPSITFKKGNIFQCNESTELNKSFCTRT